MRRSSQRRRASGWRGSARAIGCFRSTARPRAFVGVTQQRATRAPRQEHELAWTREGERMAGKFQLRREQWDDGVRPALRALRLSHDALGPPLARGARPEPASAPLRGGPRLRGDRKRDPVHRRRVRSDSAGAREPLERERPYHALRHCRPSRGQRAGLFRVGDGAHQRQPRPHQPAPDPGPRRRPPRVLPRRVGPPEAAAASRERGREPRRDDRALRADVARVQE